MKAKVTQVDVLSPLLFVIDVHGVVKKVIAGDIVSSMDGIRKKKADFRYDASILTGGITKSCRNLEEWLRIGSQKWLLTKGRCCSKK